ncbi:MAG: hypothetical protein KC736_04390 [Candidatus Moranbacteria bacterium]|nr:hypothetical protein [Candidatus Moranbacteria bacterium]
MSRLFILFATLFLFSAPGVHAQTADVPEKSPETEIVADVSIADAVVSQNDNVFSVTFTLSNGDRAQSSVRIGASLFPVDSSPFLTPVYQTVMDDTIALAQNSSRERTIQVSLPEYLSGQYDLFLEARNESGMVLSLAKAGTVTLSGDESFVELKKDTCFLSVGDEEEVSNRYDLEQGVDVSLEEKLVLHCDVVNRSDETLTVTPTYAFFFRTVFGDSVPARVVSDETYSISAGELQQLAFSIPLTLEPQAYDVTVALSNNQKVPSNEVTAHFVLQGQSATIQSVTMDKTSYRSGENAVVQVYLSGSADNFPDSRGGASFNSVATVKISLGSGSKECGETQTKQVDLSKDKSVSVSVATQIDCLMPTVSVSVADAQGNVLASENYNFTPEDVHNVSPDAKKESGSRSNSFSLVLQIGIVVFLAGFSAFFFWKKRKSSISVFVLGFLLFSGIFFSQGEVLAATSGAAHLPYDAYCDQCDPPGWIDHTTSLFASIPKSVYSPGEKVNIYGGVSYAVCTNSAKWGRWRVTNSWDSSWSYELNGQGGPTAPEIRTIHTDVSAPTVPGTYTVYVRWYDPRGYPAWYNPVTGTWRYDVSLRGKWDGTIPLTFVVGGPLAPKEPSCTIMATKLSGGSYRMDYTINWENATYSLMKISGAGAQPDISKTGATQAGSFMHTPTATTTYRLTPPTGSSLDSRPLCETTVEVLKVPTVTICKDGCGADVSRSEFWRPEDVSLSGGSLVSLCSTFNNDCSTGTPLTVNRNPSYSNDVIDVIRPDSTSSMGVGDRETVIGLQVVRVVPELPNRPMKDCSNVSSLDCYGDSKPRGGTATLTLVSATDPSKSAQHTFNVKKRPSEPECANNYTCSGACPQTAQVCRIKSSTDASCVDYSIPLNCSSTSTGSDFIER